MKVTIKDVAKALGVSVGSVSTALNDKSGISESLKSTIKEKALEMGYYPNQAARNLVQMKTNKIAIFLLSRDLRDKNENTDFLLNSLLDEARKQNKNLLVYSGDINDSINNGYIRFCKEENVIGAIFLGLRLDDPSIESIQNEASIPVVIFDTCIGGYSNTVKTNNELGVQKALNYLYNVGHRKIALVTGYDKAQVSIERFNEAKLFLESKGIFDNELVFAGDFKLKTGYEIGKQILSKKELPTAIFAFNDLMAIGLEKLFQEKKVKIPEDISIIGFDNSYLSEILELTTIAHDIEEISKKIISTILKNKRSQNIIVEPELIIRKS